MTGDTNQPQQPDLKVVPIQAAVDKEAAALEVTLAALRAGQAAHASGFKPTPGQLVMLNACAGQFSIPVGAPMVMIDVIDPPVVIDDKSWVLNPYFGTRFDVRCAVRVQDGTLVIMPIDSRLLEPYAPSKAKAPEQAPPVNVPPVGA